MSVEIHAEARVSKLADIEASVRGSRIVVAEHAFIDSFVKIKPVGGRGDVLIGPRSYLNSGCVLYSGHGIHIGSDVLIAANCTFAAVNHAFERTDIPIAAQGMQAGRGGIVIEDDVWIGANSVLLDGTYIETGAVIGAGSVVRGRVEGMAVHAGNPLRLVRRRI